MGIGGYPWDLARIQHGKNMLRTWHGKDLSTAKTVPARAGRAGPGRVSINNFII